MILHGRIVEQAIDVRERAAFVKEIVVARGAVPLAMVRKRAESDGGGTRAPVLLVHGFGQNRYAWHLPSRSLANHLARKGFDVFNLDLRGHGRSRQLGGKGSRGVEDYVDEDLPAAIEEVQALSGKREVFLLGHSLGGLVGYAAAPRLDGAIAGLVSIGSPYHFTRGSLTLTALASVLGATGTARIPSFGRLLRAPLARTGVPMRRIADVMRYLRAVADTPVYPFLRGWHAGALEPHVLEEHLRLAFDRAAMAEVLTMFDWALERRFGGRACDYVERFERMDLPLLVVSGKNDDLAPPESVKPAFVRSRARDKTYRVLPLGHIDLLVGRDAPLMTWPLVTGWMEKVLEKRAA